MRPTISLLNPDAVAGRTTDKVRIIGEGFGDIQGDSQVHVIGTILGPGDPNILYWSDTKINFYLPHEYLPPSPKLTDLWVTLEGVRDSDSNRVPLKIFGDKPLIEYLDTGEDPDHPTDTASSAASAIVRIIGLNFGDTMEYSSEVHLWNEVLDPSSIIAWSDRKIKFYLPNYYDGPWPKITSVWVTINRVNSNSKWLYLDGP